MSNKDQFLLLNLRKFNSSDIPINSKVLVIAKPGCGSQTTMEDILFHKRQKFAQGVLMTPEYDASCSWLLPHKNVFHEYDDQELLKIINSQATSVVESGSDGTQSSACVVINSLTSNASHKGLNKILMNGRSLNIFLLFGLQYSISMTPRQRNQIDYVFIGRETNFENKRKLYEHYGNFFTSFKSFSDALDEITKDDYRFMVISFRKLNCDFISTSNKKLIENCVFWYKAQEHEMFSLLSDPKQVVKPQLPPVNIKLGIPDLYSLTGSGNGTGLQSFSKDDLLTFFIEE